MFFYNTVTGGKIRNSKIKCSSRIKYEKVFLHILKTYIISFLLLFFTYEQNIDIFKVRQWKIMQFDRKVLCL